MGSVTIGRAGDQGIQSDALAKMFSLRHRVFRQKLGWNVVSIAGQESDAYDDLDPYYMIALGEGEAEGCWRLLPTTSSYMLRDTFPELLRGESAPECSSIWELSRFAVLSPARRHKGQIHLSSVAFGMFEALLEFADGRAIDHYVTVVSTSVERLMCSNGITLERFGDALTTDVGGIESVACRVRLDAATRGAVSGALHGVRTA